MFASSLKFWPDSQCGPETWRWVTLPTRWRRTFWIYTSSTRRLATECPKWTKSALRSFGLAPWKTGATSPTCNLMQILKKSLLTWNKRAVFAGGPGDVTAGGLAAVCHRHVARTDAPVVWQHCHAHLVERFMAQWRFCHLLWVFRHCAGWQRVLSHHWMNQKL